MYQVGNRTAETVLAAAETLSVASSKIEAVTAAYQHPWFWYVIFNTQFKAWVSA